MLALVAVLQLSLAGLAEADQLQASGDHESAAKEYLAWLEANPRDPNRDRALNNAAACFEHTRSFEKALALYERIIREHPKTRLADAALFRVAVNLENTYAFEKAIDAYQSLVKNYPQSKEREAALFNAARLFEGLQRYEEAAAAYIRIAELFPQSDDASSMLFRAALIYEKLGDSKRVVSTLGTYLRKYGGHISELVIDAKRRMGQAFQKMKLHADAKKSFTSAADTFDQHKLNPDQTPIAAEAAAISRFQLAEYELEKFEPIKISASEPQTFTAKKISTKAALDAYGRVSSYKRAEWTVAAQYRKGCVFEGFLNALVALSGFSSSGTSSHYLDVMPALLQRSVEAYALALATAASTQLSNEWTEKARAALERECALCAQHKVSCAPCN